MKSIPVTEGRCEMCGQRAHFMALTDIPIVRAFGDSEHFNESMENQFVCSALGCIVTRNEITLEQ